MPMTSRITRSSVIIDEGAARTIVEIIIQTIRNDEIVFDFHGLRAESITLAIQAMTSCYALGASIVVENITSSTQWWERNVSRIAAATPALAAIWWSRCHRITELWLKDGSFTKTCCDWMALFKTIICMSPDDNEHVAEYRCATIDMHIYDDMSKAIGIGLTRFIGRSKVVKLHPNFEEFIIAYTIFADIETDHLSNSSNRGHGR